MPFLNVPAHSRACESTDNAEIRLLVSDGRISPQRAKRIAELFPVSGWFTIARCRPSLLSSHRSSSSVVSLEPVERVTLFQVVGMVRRRREKSSSIGSANVSPLSLLNASFPPY